MYRKFFKRLLDIILAICILPIILFLTLIVAIFIKLDDKGPVFYKSERMGKDGKVFGMYKFRSMRVNSPDIRNTDGSTFNSKDDPRVTRIGKILRTTSLDEFPQFLNVLTGDMSIIGPRPSLTTTPYSEYSEVRRKRVSVRPGVTGYAQAYYRNSIGQDEKFMYDAYYADNISFLMDIKILMKTVVSVIGNKNINTAESQNKK